MKFKVNKKAFHQALQNIVGVVPVKTTIPILANILVDLNGNELTLTGTDLEVSISTRLDVHGDENGAAAVPAKILFEIVRELPDIPMEFSSDADSRIVINTEKGFYKLSGDSKDDFPRVTVESSQGSFQIDAERLSRMVNNTIFAVSTDELRTTLMGVYLKVMDNELRMVATDGHRLVKIVNTDFSSPGVDNESIIPTKALNLLLKNIGDSKQIKVDLAANHIIFEMANTRIISKGIEGQFPSYERVIPIDNDKTVVVDRELLASSVRRVSIFSNTITHQIRVSLTNGAVKVQCEDVEFGGEARETVDADYPSEEMDIGYNANYLLDILRHLETDEIDIRVKNPVSAAVFFPHTQNENEEILMLLMPIRLNED